MIELLLQARRDLDMGLLDQAERLYGQALAADPKNGIAAVGLACVAAERGQEREAYDLSVAALRIDPQNATAIRLETRLAEVLAYRGQPVERPSLALEAAAREEQAMAVGAKAALGGVDVGSSGASAPESGASSGSASGSSSGSASGSSSGSADRSVASRVRRLLGRAG